jgi:hypothetical protein
MWSNLFYRANGSFTSEEFSWWTLYSMGSFSWPFLSITYSSSLTKLIAKNKFGRISHTLCYQLRLSGYYLRLFGSIIKKNNIVNRKQVMEEYGTI